MPFLGCFYEHVGAGAVDADGVWGFFFDGDEQDFAGYVLLQILPGIAGIGSSQCIAATALGFIQEPFAEAVGMRVVGGPEEDDLMIARLLLQEVDVYFAQDLGWIGVGIIDGVMSEPAYLGVAVFQERPGDFMVADILDGLLDVQPVGLGDDGGVALFTFPILAGLGIKFHAFRGDDPEGRLLRGEQAVVEDFMPEDCGGDFKWCV